MYREVRQVAEVVVGDGHRKSREPEVVRKMSRLIRQEAVLLAAGIEVLGVVVDEAEEEVKLHPQIQLRTRNLRRKSCQMPTVQGQQVMLRVKEVDVDVDVDEDEEVQEASEQFKHA
jgi:hypothetical protein